MEAGPSLPKESMIKVAVPCAVISMLMWVAAHLAMHRPRGWPFSVLGEWDLLLTSQAVAGGAPPPALIGSVQGGDIGTYLVALLAAVPIALGVDPVLAGKLVATGFGAAVAGLAAAWAAVLAAHDFEVDEGTTKAAGGAWAAGLITAAALATAWPGLHFELAGINGRTPEALLPQLMATFLVLDLRRGGGVGGAAAAGVCLGVSLLLSPVAGWTVFSLCVVVMATARRRDGTYSHVERAGLCLTILGGVFVGIVVSALLLPEGPAGLAEFVRTTFTDFSLSSGSTGAAGPGPVAIVVLIGRALEGGAHNPELQWRGVMLLVAGFALAFTAFARIILSWMFEELDDAAILAAVALSWIVPLSLLPEDRWFYPLAYRYWLLPLALCAILLGAEAGRWVGTQKIGTLADIGAWSVALFLLSPLMNIERSINAPPPARADALAAAGAHRMGPRVGHDRHDTFLALSAHVTAKDRAPLVEGYGMALGGDAASNARDGLQIVHEWEAIVRRWGTRERTALLIGVGCGATALQEVPATLVESWVPAVADQEYLLYGMGLCAAEAGRVPSPEVRAAVSVFPALSPAGWRALGEGLRDGGMPRAELRRFAPDASIHARILGGWDSAARRPLHRSTVERPASLMPLRW